MTQQTTDAPADGSRRTALVTGGGGGIGRGVAVALAEQGMDVVVVGRRAEALAETANRHGRIRPRPADISEPGAISSVIDGLDRLDVLVNNAAVGYHGGLGDIDVDEAERTWRTNVLGPTLLTQAALTLLTAARGTVVNVSSTFGSRPAPNLSVYGASKAALEHLTRSWALELADRGVRVNSVAPGPTETDALVNMGLSTEQIDQVKERERRAIPLGRRGEVADVVPWIAALCAADCFVTGQVLPVDGGYVIAQ